jgi:hypothetical protein
MLKHKVALEDGRVGKVVYLGLDHRRRHHLPGKHDKGTWHTTRVGGSTVAFFSILDRQSVGLR